MSDCKVVHIHRFNEKERWSISCTTCGSHHFRLMTPEAEATVSIVECANCGAKMKNLEVLME